VEWNFEVLLSHNLVCTGTTGKLVEKAINALLRIAVVCNIPIACNRSTAGFMISSPLLSEKYAPN